MANENTGVEIVKKFTLPTWDYDKSPIVVVSVQQGDNLSRYFEIQFTDANGIVELNKNWKVFIHGKTPNCETVSAEGEIKTDLKTVRVPFGGDFAKTKGAVECEVSLTSNKAMLTSQTFYVVVSESVGSGEAEGGVIEIEDSGIEVIKKITLNFNKSVICLTSIFYCGIISRCLKFDRR